MHTSRINHQQGLAFAGAVLALCVHLLVPGQAQAIESDPAAVAAVAKLYGLDEAGARRRLKAEHVAIWTYQGVRARLGKAYGGAWFDGDAERLVVATVDEAWIDPIRVIGARPQVVSRSADDLEHSMDALSQLVGAQTWSEQVTGWYVDYPTNQVVVEVEAGWMEQVTAELATRAEDTKAYRVEASSGRIVAASTPFLGAEGYTNTWTWGSCSAGFSVQHNISGAYGFVTAGHCGDPNRGVSSFSGPLLGTFTESTFPVPGATYADRAWVSTLSSWMPQPVATNHVGGTVAVTGSLSAPVGATVCRYGFASGSTGPYCGGIQSKNQESNVNYGSQGAHTDQSEI